MDYYFEIAQSGSCEVKAVSGFLANRTEAILTLLRRDPSFSVQIAGTHPLARALRLQPDGKILVGGVFYFPEFEKPAENCKFRDCVHDKEPDCGVKEAVAAKEISKERYESYIRMLNE